MLFRSVSQSRCFPVTIRLCRAAKLLMSLGYGNFVNVVRYDIFAMAIQFLTSGGSWSISSFNGSKYALKLTSFEASSVTTY